MKEIIKNQIMASLNTLKQCIQYCSNDDWKQCHNDAPFSQVAFHTLFYTDFYLSTNEYEFKTQNFHKKNPGIFRDYEELEYKEPKETYTKEEINLYLDFCKEKISDYFKKIDNNDLWEERKHKNMKNIEFLISSVIRHIQHHAAQLGLRIQQTTGKKMEWIEK